ncbi:Gamma-glutamyl phosphate reductase [Saezia sanguinis]|uniref:Gamma-glutamyl phosphate reductase n=2 Tax=Saezia sanguinis TaxID=1965230 RepID=A0A433SC48_9BURK|nr:glutamate-5-semialdehyde dehydrogenase [Saezia sanguinis]RUS66328.1 Gamma-glutamyl phosphate reductase [Saezia sanguinis]
MNQIESLMQTLGVQARAASTQMAIASIEQRNQVLLTLATLLREQVDHLIHANQPDIQQAQAAHLAPPMVDRLRLTPEIIETLATGCEQLAKMPDPIGQMLNVHQQPSGISVGQMRVPLGVFGMIYESRPNVTIEAASLSIKSGNSAILRGGSEAMASNQALMALVHQALQQANLPEHGVQLVPTTDREAVGYMLTMPQYIDVLIPRGGRSLIERVSKEAKMPVIKHLDGNCHTYVDDPVDIEMALRVVDNAKTQKYSPCNATEGLLIARSIAPEFLPRIVQIFVAKGVEMRITPEVHQLLMNTPGAKLVPVAEDEWTAEYLAPIIRIKLVKGVDEAIAHINRFSSHHTDAILTSNHDHAMKFVREVDSSSVMVNTSTRFADGFEYGLGAEIGISTDKFHARGPVGLEGLTSLKWVVMGHGEVRT